MDLVDIKGRIAVALVESIFRRAGFILGPVPAPKPSTRPGREELTPDFAVHRAGSAEGRAPRAVEVRYRSQIGQYLAIEGQRAGNSVFALAKRQWPDLLFVFVTDHPEAGRSGYQVVDLAGWEVGAAVSAVDLPAHSGLAIYPQNVEEHERLLRRMVALLVGAP
jgi:hypothetical protein